MLWLQKEHKLKVFAGARVCFVGFPEDETQHMAEVLASNGGVTCPLDDPDCTHVVSPYTFISMDSVIMEFSRSLKALSPHDTARISRPYLTVTCNFNESLVIIHSTFDR